MSPLPPTLIMLKSNPQCDGIRRWAFGRWSGHKGGALMSGISAHIEPGASQVALMVKNPSANAGDVRDVEFNPWIGKIPWRRTGQPTTVFLPEESPGQRSLAGYSPKVCKESGTAEVTACTQRRA